MRPKSQAPACMIGRLAKTLTPLRTAGIVEIDDQHIEVYSKAGFIPAGTIVRIVGKMSSWYTVEPLTYGYLNSASA